MKNAIKFQKTTKSIYHFILHVKWIVILLMGMLNITVISHQANAESVVYIQNNSTRTLTFNTSVNLSTAYWSQGATTVLPGERKMLFKTNRDKGITNGKHFHFNTSVKSAHDNNAEALTLRVQLRGSLVGSHMWQSISGHDWEDEDGKVHSRSWYVGKNKFNQNVNLKVSYWSYFTGGDSDIEYVFQEEYPLPDGNHVTQSDKNYHKNHLDVLSYNVYMRPTNLFINGQSHRANIIPSKVQGYDVVVLQEAFDDDVREKLNQGMKNHGYQYQTSILGSDSGTRQDGGVIIYSKYPIKHQAQKLFKGVCSGWDCDADKGVLYAKIDKLGVNYHIFGTHLNNGNNDILRQQFKIVKDFIDTQKLGKSERVILAGDMNVHTEDEVYQEMLRTINVTPVFSVGGGGIFYTFDETINKLTDSGTRKRLLDYVFYSNAHRKPASSTRQIRLLRTNSEWKDLPHEKAIWELSDHYPVYASLDYAKVEENDHYTYTGVWLKDNNNNYLFSRNKSWNSFVKDWDKNSKNGYRLKDVEVLSGGKFSGVFEKGGGGYAFYAVDSWKKFTDEWAKHSKKGLRLVDFETYTVGKKTNFVGVYTAGKQGYSLYRISNWSAFIKQCNSSHKQGLRLIDFHTDVENGVRYYTGVWLSGKYGNYIKRHSGWKAFTDEWKRMAKKNYRLVDMETYKSGNKTYYVGVYKSGKQGYYLWRQQGWATFSKKMKELSTKGYRLVDIELE